MINDVFGTYTAFLLEGFTIKIDSKIVVQTIREYLVAVNEHYISNGFDLPHVRNDDSQVSNLLNSAEEFEGAAAKRNPLNHKNDCYDAPVGPRGSTWIQSCSI